MLCKSCGVEVTVEATFCHKCGNPVERVEENPTGQSDIKAPADEFSASNTEGSDTFRDRISGNQNDNDDREEHIWRGGYSSKAMIGWWITAGFATLLLAVIGISISASSNVWFAIVIIDLLLFLYLGLLLGYRKLNVHYQLTNQRFVHQSGILRRVTDRIEVIDMDDITFEQGIIERMLGVGKIRITSSDRTHPEIVLLGIDNVKEIAGLLDDARRKERVRRGVHIEAI